MYAWFRLYIILIKSLSHPFESALDRPASCLLLHPQPVNLPNLSTLVSFASQKILLHLKFKTAVIVQKIRILTGVVLVIINGDWHYTKKYYLVRRLSSFMFWLLLPLLNQANKLSLEKHQWLSNSVVLFRFFGCFSSNLILEIKP